MEADVFGTGHNFEVVEGVVQRIVVFVMNGFGSPEFPAQDELLGKPDMFGKLKASPAKRASDRDESDSVFGSLGIGRSDTASVRLVDPSYQWIAIVSKALAMLVAKAVRMNKRGTAWNRTGVSHALILHHQM